MSEPVIIFVSFLILLASCYALSFQIMHGLARVSGKYVILRVILFPGVILHELSHAFACLITGTPIQNISFWDETGGSVVHHKPKFSFLTQPVISFAPFPIGILSLLSLSHWLPHLHWYSGLLVIFLMMSIAGTLAPSKADMIHAIEGSIVFIAIIGATYYFFPHFMERLVPTIQEALKPLLSIDIFLFLLWIILASLAKTIQHVRVSMNH